ncbi:MAG: mechanosensitive ion channel [Alphaproteobacteria bacterium]|nr:mechanosensitive ion channel [Alphaproteobacteria bacterium]
MRNILILIFIASLSLNVCAETPSETTSSSQGNSVQSLEKQLETISKSQMDYINRFNKLLDIFDKPEKRAEVCKSLKNDVYNKLIDLKFIEDIIYLFIKIIVIYGLYYALRSLAKRVIHHKIEAIKTKHPKQETVNYKNSIDETISKLIYRILTWIFRIITTLLVLDILKVNVYPILLGLSFLCITIAFAAKSIVEDFINGIITLLRGTMCVGEVVKIGESKGEVEEINLKYIVLRLSTGAIEIIPFSAISRIVNYSRDYHVFESKILIEGNQDISLIELCFKNALAELKSIPTFEQNVESDLTFNGVIEFTEHGCRVSASIKSIPDPGNSIGYIYNQYVHKQMRINNIKFSNVGK